MIKNIEIFKFNKKPKLLITNNCNPIINKNNYSSERGKKYSQLFNRILNSNKLDTKKMITNASKGIINKKNNIKKITFFKPEELKLNKFSSIIKTRNNVNMYQYYSNCNEFNLISNSELKKNKSKEKENDKRVKIKGQNYNKILLINNIKKKNNKKVIEKNLRNKYIKKKSSFKKEKESKKIEINKKNEQNKKEIKNNIKNKKVDILNDNNIFFDLNLKNKKEKINYIFKQKKQKNYEVKRQELPKLNSITEKNKSYEDKSERIINESLNIIDSFTNKITLTKNRTINKNYRKIKKKTSPKYVHTDISQFLLNSFNNAEMKTTNSTGFIDIQSPFNIKGNSKKIKKYDKSRNVRKFLLNISEMIKNKINQKYDKSFSFNWISKPSQYLNVNKPSGKKIVHVRIRNINNLSSNEKKTGSKKNLLYNNHKYKYSDIYINSYYSKKKNNYYSPKSLSIEKGNNKYNFNKIRNDRKKHETVRNNIDDIGQKLLILVNNFHSEHHQIGDKTFNAQSGKLIDRIRAIKKINNI